MASLLFIVPGTIALNPDSFRYSKIHTSTLAIGTSTLDFQGSSQPSCALKRHLPCFSIQRSHSHSDPQSDGVQEDTQDSVQDLKVPNQWLSPLKALEESEWLRVTLHKWLDDEYCPEATNIEISKVAARSYYISLVEKQTDLGEILLKMARELERISYQESFHGAFSSANAAVSLIIQRIEQD